MLNSITKPLAIGALPFLLLACNDAPLDAELERMTAGTPASPRSAVAQLTGTEGHDVTGEVTFTARGDDAVEVSVRLVGLTPGEYGFHVHEQGDCSASDGTSAGGHFNPENVRHGARTDEVRHVGDLGNVTANDAGVVETIFIDRVIRLTGEHSVVGLALMVHQGADDFSSQPSGDAGARVACGVIEATSAE
jgi:Cu-Zn family superoxide dismutase